MKRSPDTISELLKKYRTAIRSDKISALRRGIYQAIFFRKIRLLPNRIAALSNALAASAGNEARFLDIGRTLQSIYTDTADLIRFIRETIQSVMGDTDEKNILEKVGGLARRTETALLRHQERVAVSLTQIKEVADHLGGLHQACDHLGRIAMNLRVVGLNIGVESTRSAEGKEMFTVVAQEILQLSDSVNAIAGRIREDATTAMTEQMAAFDTISNGLQMLKGLTAEAAGVVNSAVAETDRGVAAFVKAFETADGQFQKISSRVGNIVMGMQFHDNMRQRVEHITDALVAAARIFRGDDSKTTSGMSTPDAPADRLQILGNACDMVSLQKAQLADIISEIYRVHGESVTAFEEIRSEIQELAGTMSSVSTGQGLHAADPFSKLNDALTGLGGLLDQGDALGRRIVESISKASEISRRFSQHLTDVDKISFETKIKALNAIVKAGHMSEEGRTLEVLAQEMNRLSQQTNGFVDRVEEKLTQVGKFGEIADAEQSGSTEAEGPHELFDLSEILSRDIDKLDRMRSLMDQRAGEASEKADDLRTTVSRTVSELDFLTALAGEMSGHLDVLDAIDGKLSDLSGKWNPREKAGMEKLTDTYTMQRERTIHRNALLAETQKALPEKMEAAPPPDSEPEADISLWDDFGDPPREETKESIEENSPKEEDNAEDFGDNIELF